ARQDLGIGSCIDVHHTRARGTLELKELIREADKVSISHQVGIEESKVSPTCCEHLIRENPPRHQCAPDVLDCLCVDIHTSCAPNGSTFSRKPREHTTANLICPYARIAGCNVVLSGPDWHESEAPQPLGSVNESDYKNMLIGQLVDEAIRFQEQLSDR